MSEITVTNTDEYGATVTVTHWNTPIGHLTFDLKGTKTIGTTTSAAVKAAANVNGKDLATGSFGFTETAVTFVVSMSADGSLQLTKEPETAVDTITFSNKCSVPVQFQFTPDDAGTQIYEVPPGEELPLGTGMQWQAFGSALDNQSFSIPTVSFNDGNALLTVVRVAHDEYRIDVSTVSTPMYVAGQETPV